MLRARPAAAVALIAGLSPATLVVCHGRVPEPESDRSNAPNDTARSSSGTGDVRRVALPSSPHVFIIALENQDAADIYGNTADAPYINRTLLSIGARATGFHDELPLPLPSEPHYLWMEAGTNVFGDHTFTMNFDPSTSNSTSSTAHLVTQIAASSRGWTWRSYQEGLDETTGACPIHSSGLYAAKHDPFVFFQDVAGSPPSETNAGCAAHHRAYAAFAGDLAKGEVATYTFVTPNLCNDMHGAATCPSSNMVASGDAWLSAELPQIIRYVDGHGGVIFVTWDEGRATAAMPLIALGPTVKAGYSGGVAYDHGSLVRTVEELLGLPLLATVADDNSLADLFTKYP
jgi:hypothetical protein